MADIIKNSNVYSYFTYYRFDLLFQHGKHFDFIKYLEISHTNSFQVDLFN